MPTAAPHIEDLVDNVFVTNDHVGKGAEWLDQVYPGWHEKIDVDRLNEASSLDCVLAQVTGVSWAQIGRMAENWEDFFSWSVEFGFSSQLDEDYDATELAWLVEIERRLD